MKVLVIGSGGREHALAWKVASSPLVSSVLVAPGNAGTARERNVENVALSPTDGARLVELCEERGVGLVVVGPEAALVAGIPNRLRAAGFPVVGPGADGARLEGSKAWAKEIMEAAGVPTAAWARCASPGDVDRFCSAFRGDALVVKADGLAAGKGVIVCDSVAQARAEAHRILTERPFGDAGDTVVIEERLLGPETSFIVLTDGSRFLPFPTSQDHKRLLDGDRGPNTGGMGAYSPAPFVTPALQALISETVIAPTLAELRRRGIDYRGFLYAGVMLTREGPRVLEFNARLGDPEAQVLLTALCDDIVPALRAAADGRLTQSSLGPTRAAAVVVLAAAGYPDRPVIGEPIHGLTEAAGLPHVRVFHAGTRLDGDAVVVSGGRVLGVTAEAEEPVLAVARAYRAVDCVRWQGMQHRRDIGGALSV